MDSNLWITRACHLYFSLHNKTVNFLPGIRSVHSVHCSGLAFGVLMGTIYTIIGATLGAVL
jgi:uncharacterized membrane protein YdjX (TVP38/TMEM64 family)